MNASEPPAAGTGQRNRLKPEFCDTTRHGNPMNTVTGWYFSEESRFLRYGDARPIALGVTHEADAPIELCERGLHASVRAIDLDSAPGPDCLARRVVWRNQIGDDKCVCNAPQIHRRWELTPAQ